MRTKYPPTLSTEEFRARIRALCTGRSLNEIQGASHAHPLLVRKPADPKYNPANERKPQ